MITWLTDTFLPAKSRDDALEREKIARLEQAEQEVRSLTERGETAVRFLIARNDRNHWRESIQQMIQGVL